MVGLCVAKQGILREHKTMYYVYVLQDFESRKSYIGYSSNLKNRIHAHKSKKVQSTKMGDYQLIYYEAYLNKKDALGREKFLKGGSGRKYINKQMFHYFDEQTV